MKSTLKGKKEDSEWILAGWLCSQPQEVHVLKGYRGLLELVPSGPHPPIDSSPFKEQMNEF